MIIGGPSPTFNSTPKLTRRLSCLFCVVPLDKLVSPSLPRPFRTEEVFLSIRTRGALFRPLKRGGDLPNGSSAAASDSFVARRGEAFYLLA